MDYKKLTESYKDELLQSLNGFVNINSVFDESSADKNNPFGLGVSKALQFIDNLAKKDGFKSTNYDNMIVEILVGNGKKNITILAHADVVPEGTGWDQDPFSVVEKNGVLYGRGVADDKGPLLSCYYGLKALRDNNLLGDYTIRFLIGGNEESGSLGVEHYFKDLKKPQPDLGFSPDSSYPLIYAEKEIVNFNIEKKVKCEQIISIKGGVASNSVIERCVAVVKRDNNLINYLKQNNVNFSYEDNDENLVISFLGKAAHGSLPWEGDNAGIHCLEQLGNYYNNEDLKFIAEKFGDPRGKGLNVDSYSPEMKENSLNVGIISLESDNFKMVVNFRFTNVCKYEDIVQKFENNSKPFTAKAVSRSPLLYYPVESELVSTLLQVYQEETGDFDTPPLTTGGGTYAKEANNVIAFGMEYPGWDAHMHSPGECCKISHLVESMAIYAHAIIELGKKLNEN